jgi:Ca2+-binding EF-hand superfamily protein
VPEVEDEIVTMEQFSDFYADISLAIFEDVSYIKLVEDSWRIAEASFKQVS